MDYVLDENLDAAAVLNQNFHCATDVEEAGDDVDTDDYYFNATDKKAADFVSLSLVLLRSDP